MKTHLIIIAITFISLTGCAANQPQRLLAKQGVSNEQMFRDKITCKQLAMQTLTSQGLQGNFLADVKVERDTTKCMNELGYY